MSGGVPIPVSRQFKQLGPWKRLAAEKGMGPVVRGRLHKGLAITHMVCCPPSFPMPRKPVVLDMEEVMGGPTVPKQQTRGRRGRRWG